MVNTMQFNVTKQGHFVCLWSQHDNGGQSVTHSTMQPPLFYIIWLGKHVRGEFWPVRQVSTGPRTDRTRWSGSRRRCRSQSFSAVPRTDLKAGTRDGELCLTRVFIWVVLKDSFVALRWVPYQLLCCPLSPGTCSTSACPFLHPCEWKQTAELESNQWTSTLLNTSNYNQMENPSFSANIRHFATTQWFLVYSFPRTCSAIYPCRLFLCELPSFGGIDPKITERDGTRGLWCFKSQEQSEKLNCSVAFQKGGM